jgi:hypothetical protein
LAVAALLPIGRANALAGFAVLYHGGALITLGCTPATWAIDTYVRSQHPSASARGPRFLRLLARSSDR